MDFRSVVRPGRYTALRSSVPDPDSMISYFVSLRSFSCMVWILTQQILLRVCVCLFPCPYVLVPVPIWYDARNNIMYVGFLYLRLWFPSPSLPSCIQWKYCLLLPPSRLISSQLSFLQFVFLFMLTRMSCHASDRANKRRQPSSI